MWMLIFHMKHPPKHKCRPSTAPDGNMNSTGMRNRKEKASILIRPSNSPDPTPIKHLWCDWTLIPDNSEFIHPTNSVQMVCAIVPPQRSPVNLLRGQSWSAWEEPIQYLADGFNVICVYLWQYYILIFSRIPSVLNIVFKLGFRTLRQFQ